MIPSALPRAIPRFATGRTISFRVRNYAASVSASAPAPPPVSVTGRRPKISWLDLRGAGLSIAERLAIEEALLRHDPLERCWAIVGSHEPTENRMLKIPLPQSRGDGGEGGSDDARRRRHVEAMAADGYGHVSNDGTGTVNRSCAIVLGIGGKVDRLVNVEQARSDGVLALRRFSGGGTVVVDHSSLLTTFIGRTEALPDVKPFPREIMKWSADVVFGPAFARWGEEITAKRRRDGDVTTMSGKGKQTLVFQGKSCGLSGAVGESLVLQKKNESTQPSTSPNVPVFRLRENDYVFGERKIAGNAQSIVKGGWLHHTSFLWDYDVGNMQYLTLPDKRPSYRGDRTHDNFLLRLKDYFGDHSSQRFFFTSVKGAVGESFELEEATLSDVTDIINNQFGDL